MFLNKIIILLYLNLKHMIILNSLHQLDQVQIPIKIFIINFITKFK